MAARKVYTEQERNAVYVALVANQWNLKRTARDMGVPVSTLRDWKAEWEVDPPAVEEVAEAVGEFLGDAERVRHKALQQLESKLSDATPSALVATVGMLTDKIAMARGLATARTETVHALPSAADMANQLGQALQRALESARERDGDIIDAEIVALPAPSDQQA